MILNTFKHIWYSYSVLFIAYILIEYVINPFGVWKLFPDINDKIISKISLYTHFICGTIIMIIGPFQFLDITHRLKIHKYIGISYLISCILCAIGGLIFISTRGTVGGIYMSIPFAVYGLLMFVYPIITYYYIYKKDYRNHNKWAIRLFLLGNGSMLYRMLYIIACKFFVKCFPVTFKSIMDYTFDWLFFVIPMICAEIYLFIKN